MPGILRSPTSTGFCYGTLKEAKVASSLTDCLVLFVCANSHFKKTISFDLCVVVVEVLSKNHYQFRALWKIIHVVQSVTFRAHTIIIVVRLIVSHRDFAKYTNCNRKGQHRAKIFQTLSLIQRNIACEFTKKSFLNRHDNFGPDKNDQSTRWTCNCYVTYRRVASWWRCIKLAQARLAAVQIYVHFRAQMQSESHWHFLRCQKPQIYILRYF